MYVYLLDLEAAYGRKLKNKTRKETEKKTIFNDLLFMTGKFLFPQGHHENISRKKNVKFFSVVKFCTGYPIENDNRVHVMDIDIL